VGDGVSTAIRNVLEQYPQIKIATVFGSAARDQLTEGSDIDVAVAAETPLPLAIRLDLATKLSQALQREVDLIDLQDVSGFILQQSLCQGKIILQKDPVLPARLIKRLWFNQADMIPYTRRILAERRRRFLHG
jgi:predicted nucleotidyltransferase